ncbi:zinc finger protein-like 1 homolog [Ctenocephalides felis]|uniref:zinc finger protein-like 1 homolog n=1 Tax=Ctenocephalides felis TaxID=7515 RepID=UPI000E6E15D6|nr:zinc finger protein-like 1 homolog [Ctenocephalides felis]
MGLCKCPKRRVTNQFCFEHHVNVCENCMVTNHSKCVVQSYIQWLQDSDYNAGCQLCNSEITNDDFVRLTCYHVFHWSCLQSMAGSLPPNVAPAGYRCPQCGTGIFPQPNLISPVADILRGKLGLVNWGRSGLGLPLLAETRDPPDGCKVSVDFDTNIQNSSEYSNSKLQSNNLRSQNTKPIVHSSDNLNNTQHNYSNFYSANSQMRRSSNRPTPIGRVLDSDDDKYKRRSPKEMLTRFINRAACFSPVKKQRFLTFILVIIIFVSVIMILKELSHRSNTDDGQFDLENEPKVVVGDV